MSAFFNPVIASITVRATLGRRRALLFAIPAVVLIALTLAVRATHPTGSTWEAQILGDFGFSVLLPLLALIIGTGVLGAEIDHPFGQHDRAAADRPGQQGDRAAAGGLGAEHPGADDPPEGPRHDGEAGG